jgi:dTDP-4-amino-4,6-dideoxygalactose transaminase
MATMQVPLLDLKAQYESMQTEIEETVLRVCRSQQFILGPEVEGLERELADYCETKYAVAMSSGTDALLAALAALGVGAGDEVITTPFTFFATAGCIWRAGATPVFVDVDPASFNLDPRGIESAITSRTKAIMPVHLYGQCADMDPINAIARKHGLAVIEDAAQAIGAEYRGKRAGSLSAIGCFSFFPTKNLGGFGDGGAVTTDDPELYARLKLIRTHGDVGNYKHAIVGANFRIDALQAAVLRVKLRKLDEWTEARQRNAAAYHRLFAERGLLGGSVKAPASLTGRHVYNQYVVRVDDRDRLMQHLAARGVGTRVYYPISLHQQECFKALGYGTGDMPKSEAAARESLALPIYPELTAAQIRYVADSISEFYREGRQAVRKAG